MMKMMMIGRVKKILCQKLRICPALEIPSDLEWESVLELMIDILKELVMELKHIKLLQVPHITTGFCDGDLEIIK